MAPERDHRYDPVPPIPTYEEAIAGGSGSNDSRLYNAPPSPIDDHRPSSAEGQFLLGSDRPSHPASSHQARGRRPQGYRPPTVETDDDSLFGSDDDDDSNDADEAEHIRREMQEMEIDDSDVLGRGRSSWGKRIGFSLSLPQWRWSWRPRLPRLRPWRRPSPNATGEDGAAPAPTPAADTPAPANRFAFPQLGSPALFMLVARLLALFIIMGFLYLLFSSNMMSNAMNGGMADPESVRMAVQARVSRSRIRDRAMHFTNYAHLAGTEGDYGLMKDTELLLAKSGVDEVSRDVYHVYLNYPKPGGRAVELLGPDGKANWTAKLEEDEVHGEPQERRTQAFHGLSKAGEVAGPLIYANLGTREDFQALKNAGIDTQGAIALVRHHGPRSDQGLRVKAAELAGFAGCLIYTEPKGYSIPADGVQRASVGLQSLVLGDVLTPGWGSKEDMPRFKPEQAHGLVKIPSLPLAWRDAEVLFQRLEGFGQRVPKGWQDGAPERWMGNQSSPVVRLKNEQFEVEKKPIWNVYGRILGTEQPEKRIIIGNRRDSWTAGAVGHSGTAVMLEIAELLGSLVNEGWWRPLRTIEFMSWDGGQYNNIGSTEYVEQHEDMLRLDAFAYINLDTAITGDSFHASGSPVFRRLLQQILNRVADPNFNTTLRTLWDRRQGELEGLGGGSDFVAFQDLVGTSSIDLRFEGKDYPANTGYETSEWMDTTGDPGYVYHGMLAEVVGLLVVELSSRPILPFEMAAYVESLPKWVDQVTAWTKEKKAGEPGAPLDLSSLKRACDDLSSKVGRFNAWEVSWENRVIASSGWEPGGLGRERCEYNSRMARFETDLLDNDGIPNRTQYKHVLFAPKLWSGYDVEYLPSIRDTVESGNWTLAQSTINKVADIITHAAHNLVE